MGINYLDIGLQSFSPGRFNPDFSLRTRVLALQTGALNQLLSDAVLTRLLDSEVKVAKANQALTLPELFAALRGSIWSEFKTGGSIPGPRRDLQREHLRRIANVLTRPSPTTPSDATRPLPRGGEAALGADQDGSREWQPRPGDACAPHRIGRHARRGAEGADHPAGSLSIRPAGGARA